jgi:hypothetical protein
MEGWRRCCRRRRRGRRPTPASELQSSSEVRQPGQASSYAAPHTLAGHGPGPLGLVWLLGAEKPGN